MIIGVGGTGGNFAKEFCRYLSKYQNTDVSVKVVFIDGDIVETKNCERQPFIEDDVNLKKAIVLAEAVGDTFGFDVISYPNYIIEKDQLDSIFYKCKINNAINIPVIIGCADNHRCRQVLHEYYTKESNCIYFDSGNEFSLGEVVFASKMNMVELSPPRAHYFPDVLTDTSPNKEEESCQVVNETSPQHLATNIFAANILLTACVQLLSSGKVMNGIVYFDTFGFFARHQEVIEGGKNIE